MNLYNHNLTRVTIIIFSRRRQESLRKTIEYFSKFPINVVIFDDSKTPLYSPSIPTRIRYIHSPNSINVRRKEALNWIRTEFAMMVSDDEAILPRGLQEMINALDQDPQLSCVGGSTLAIWKFGPKVCGYWPYSQTTGKHIVGESVLQRIEALNLPENFLGVSFMYYNLFRARVLKELLTCAAEISEKFGIECGEELSLLVSLEGGNVRYIRELYWIRNWNRLPKNSPGIDRRKSLAVWWRDTATVEEKESFMNELSQLVLLNQTSKVLENCWELIISYARPFGISGLITRRKNLLSNLPYVLLKLLRWISFCAKKLLMPRHIPVSAEVALKEFSSSGIGFEENEVQLAIGTIKDI